ncbi:MAG: hypothetical protein AB1797_05345, partial [bacterium]
MLISLILCLQGCSKKERHPLREGAAVQPVVILQFAPQAGSPLNITSITLTVSGPNIESATFVAPGIDTAGREARFSIEIPAGRNRTFTAQAFDGDRLVLKGSLEDVDVTQDTTITIPLIPVIPVTPLISLTKSDSPDPVQAGADLTYTLTVANSGNAIANNLVITETYDDNTTFSWAEPDPDAGSDNRWWTFSNLSPGASQTITIRLAVTSPLANGTVLTNSASVVSDETPTPVKVTETTTVGSAPKLSITKTDSPDPVQAGSDLTYTLTVTNSGNAVANNLVITETYDANTTFSSADPAPDAGSGNRRWTFSSLSPGASQTITIRLAVASPLANGTVLTNSASVVSDETPTPEKVTETTTVGSAPKLSITKTDSPDLVQAGSDLTYTLTVTNSGNAVANNVVITETYDANTTFSLAEPAPDAGSGNRWWTFSSLSPVASQTITIWLAVASPLANGTVLTNSASVVSDETPTPEKVTETTMVTSAPIISITKTDSSDLVEAGADLTYTLTVTNSGNAVANNMVITETYDANTTFSWAKPDPDTGSGNRRWTFSHLSPGASQTITVRLAVASPLANGTVLTNLASVVSDETPTPEKVTETTTVGSAPKLSITKTDSPDLVQAGSDLTYTLTVTNSGNAVANNVVITETYDDNTTFSWAEPAPDAGSGNRWWTFSSLSPVASQTITVRLAVTSPLANGTVLTNLASVVSDETPTPEKVTETTTVESKPVISITKYDLPDPIQAGSDLTYTLTVTNSGNAVANNLVITETYDANTTFSWAEPTPDAGSGNRRWTFSNLSPDASQTITIRLAVASPLPDDTVLTNLASVVSNETPAPVETVKSTTVASAPIISITKTDSPDPVEAGADLTYTLTVANSGNAVANNLVITETYDANITFSSADPAPDAGSGNRRWTFSSLSPVASQTITIRLAVASPLANGTVLTNLASVVSDETPTPEKVTETTTVTSAPIISITKTDSSDLVEAGADLTYTLTVANSGNAVANNLVITETYDANTTFSWADLDPDDGTTNQWTFSSLSSGENKTITIRLAVASPLTNGTVLTNRASVVTDETPTPEEVTETTTVGSAPKLSITKTDSPDPVQAGANLTYSLTVTNSGNAVANNLVITETYDANTTFFSAEPPPVVDTTNQWSFSSLSPGASQTITIWLAVASPLANGTVLTNSASVVSDETPTPEKVTETTTVTTAPFISITKTDSSDLVQAGSDLIYTLTVANSGNAVANNLVITETYDANTTFFSAEPAPNADSGNRQWTFSSLSPDTSQTITIRLSVASPLTNGTVLTNLASVVSDETPTPEKVTETTTVSSAPALSLAKSDSPDPVESGGSLTYTVMVSNADTANETATNVVVSETYDPKTIFISANPATDDGTNHQWTFNRLSPGESQVITINLKAASDLSYGTILTNRATAVSDEITAPLEVSEETEVDVPPIIITKSDSPEPVEAGDILTYTLFIRNNRPSWISNVEITEIYDPNVTFQSAEPSHGISNKWIFTSLASGEEKTIRIGVKVKAPLPNGTILTNQASVVSSEVTTPIDVSETTTVYSSPLLSLKKTDDPDSVGAGNRLIYTLTVANANTASATATNVTVTETYDPNINFIQAEPSPDVGDNQWNLGDLVPGQSQPITIEVEVDSPLSDGTILTNSASAMASEIEEPAQVVEQTAIQAAPILTIEKSDFPDPVETESSLSYTLKINNSGNAVANNLIIIETYPGNILFVSATPKPEDGTDTQWKISRLTPGTEATITIQAKVIPPLTDRTVLTNRVSLRSDEITIPEEAEEQTTVWSPILEFSKSDSPDPVVDGDTLTYTLQIKNTGSAKATNVILTETYDDKTTFKSAVPFPDAGSSNRRWTFERLSPGASQTITIQLQVALPLPDGTVLTNSASVMSDQTSRQEKAIETTVANTYTITASVGNNGSISPSGAVTVNHGGSQTFTITPNTGYHIADVKVDGSSVGAVSTYPFTNVTSNHTITATFAINTYTITASAGNNGSISPSGAVTVNHGGSQTFTITPNTGYHIADVKVDGSSV